MLQKSIVKSNISTNDQNLMAHSLVASTYAFYDVWDYFHVALALNILNLYLITGQNTETKWEGQDSLKSLITFKQQVWNINHFSVVRPVML